MSSYVDYLCESGLFAQLAIDLSRKTGQDMQKFRQSHPILGRVFCPFVCLGALVVKLALRIFALVEPILITPIALAVLIAMSRYSNKKFSTVDSNNFIARGLILLPINFGTNLYLTTKYTFIYLLRHGSGVIFGAIAPDYFYNKMDYMHEI